MVAAGSHSSGSKFLSKNVDCLSHLIFSYYFFVDLCFLYNKVVSCSASKEKNSDENYWIVGLNASKLFSIVCKNPDLFPQVG